MSPSQVIDLVNAQLSDLADGHRLRYLDTEHHLADSAGRLLPGVADTDQLHLGPPAYELWAQALRPILAETLGPAASTDEAPPPTSDPSLLCSTSKLP